MVKSTCKISWWSESPPQVWGCFFRLHPVLCHHIFSQAEPVQQMLKGNKVPLKKKKKYCCPMVQEGSLLPVGHQERAFFQKFLTNWRITCRAQGVHYDGNCKKLDLINDAPSLILRTTFGSCLISWIFHLNEVLLFCSFLLPVRIYKIRLLQLIFISKFNNLKNKHSPLLSLFTLIKMLFSIFFPQVLPN